MSPKQREYLTAISAFIEAHGYSPTLQEIGDAVGSTVASVRDALIIMERRGWITRQYARAASTRLTDAGRAELEVVMATTPAVLEPAEPTIPSAPVRRFDLRVPA